MDKDFDPYHKWLSIPPNQQPPHLYRLLGIPLFETEADVIENCADQRMALLRTFQSGKHSDLSQKLLNEISSAKLELLDPDKKLAYDKKLRAKIKSKKAASESQLGSKSKPQLKTRGSSIGKRSSSQKKKSLPTAEPLELKTTATTSPTRGRVRKKSSPLVPAILLGVGGVLAVLIAVVVLSSGGDPATESNPAKKGNIAVAEKPPTTDPAAETPDKPKQPDEKETPEKEKPHFKFEEKPPENPSEATPLDESVNLLSLIVPQRDGIQGNWKFEKGVLVTPLYSRARLQIPFEPPEEYQIDMVVVPKKGDDCLTLGLVFGERQVAALLDAWRGQHSGLDQIDGRRPRDSGVPRAERIFVTGQRRNIRCQVRTSGIRVLVDDEVVIQWEGNPQQLSLHDDWKMPSQSQLFLGEYRTAFEIHKLTIGPIREKDSSEPSAIPEPVVYLDDLPEASVAVGHGRLGKHGATGYEDPEDPRDFQYQDQQPEHALSAHPSPNGSSHLTYYIDGKYESLKTTGALMQAEDKPVDRTPLSFKIFGDGELLWESQPVKNMGQGEDCQVSVAGVHVLRLQIDCPGPSAMRRAVWISPRLEAAGADTPSEESQETRLAVPDSTLRDAAEAKIRELFAAEIKQATTSDKKVALAEEFLKLAGDNSDDVVDRFVLFQLGWTLAVDSGVSEPALRAVVDLAGLYEVDSIKMRVTTLERVARKALGKEKRIALATDALPIIEEALRLEDYEAAAGIGKIALTAARKAADKDLVKQIAAQNKFTGEIAKAAEEARYAQTTLEGDPENPGANLTAGRFFCFLKDDWPTGLPMLALSGQAALEQVAKAELAEPNYPSDHAKLGGMWWDLAKGESDVIRGRLLQRSAFWYRLAEPLIKDRTSKTTIEKRLAIIDQREAARLVEAWISQEATYTVSSQFEDKRPLPSLLTDDESLHANGEFAFHTRKDDPAKAIVIDLQSEMPVTRLSIENRRQPNLYHRARGLTLWLSSSPTDQGQPVWIAPLISASWEVKLPKPVKARYVTLGLRPDNREALHLAKVKVFGLTRQSAGTKLVKQKPGTKHPFLGYELKKHPEGAIPFGGHWYQLLPQGASWYAAHEHCKQMGGYLICIEHPAEALLAKQLAAGHHCWCGGIKVNNVWGWMNGSPISYFNWKGGEPNNSKGVEDRIEIIKDGRWNDMHGHNRKRYICEWEF